ncbi:MAG: hypothetical protein Q9204_002254 [Flavoplaca sp. TL-2023a]
MADQKQIIDLKGVGGYILQEKLEELLAQKYGRKIEVQVKTDDCFTFYAPGKPTEEELDSSDTHVTRLPILFPVCSTMGVYACVYTKAKEVGLERMNLVARVRKEANILRMPATFVSGCQVVGSALG